MAYGDNIFLDGDLLVPRPTRIIPHPPKIVAKQSATDGGYIGFRRAKGWWWELEWGSELVDDEALIALNDIFNGISNPTGTITFSYEGNYGVIGEATIFNVLFDEEVAAPIRWGSVHEKLVVELYEAASTN